MVVPRNFRLLEEYDCAIGKEEKTFVTHPHSGFVQYGADESKNDMLLHHWEGIIIGPQGSNIGECMYTIKIFVPDNYPQVPPEVQFIGQQIAMPCVRADGRVDPSRISGGFQWHYKQNIADILMAVRSNMHDASVIQASAALIGKMYA